jgi:hypothetical protein
MPAAGVNAASAVILVQLEGINRGDDSAACFNSEGATVRTIGMSGRFEDS